MPGRAGTCFEVAEEVEVVELVETVEDDDDDVEGSGDDDDNDDVEDRSIILKFVEAGTCGMLVLAVTKGAAVEMLVRMEFRVCGVCAAYMRSNIGDLHFLFELHFLVEGSGGD